MFDKYRHKPVTIDAVQWDGTVEMARALVNICPDVDFFENICLLQVKSSWGTIVVYPKDWLVRSPNGSMCVHKPEVFDSSYAKATK